MSISAGEQLGPYVVLGPVGRGGMGAVYRARDPRLDREVAIKVLREELGAAEDRLRRFEQEARAASALNHSNILTVYDVGSHEGRPYLVTELLEGETLRERITRGPMAPGTALPIAASIARGLAAAHSRGIVHRDLKPENVFLTRDGEVKILDFGIAKLLPVPEEGATEATPSEALTDTLALLGTPAYMSPEQVSGGPVDYRADQFALGCLLHEMLTGERTFARASAPLTLAAVAAEEPLPLSRRRPDLPVPLLWVVERCLSKEPEARYAATGDLAHDLALLRDRRGELEPPESPHSAAQRGVRSWPWLAAAGLVVAVAFLWTWLGTRRPAPPVPELRLLTYSGRDASPDASPDGRTVVFSSERDGRRRIWVKDVVSGAEVPLTEGAHDDLPRFSSDGSQILFVRRSASSSDLYRVAAVGGEPRRVAVDALGGDWMPDGGVVFVRWTVREAITRSLLGRIRADGSGEKVIAHFEGLQLHHPRVGPYGRRVALSDIGRQAGVPVAVWIVDLQTGAASPLPGQAEIGPLSAPAWLEGGERVVYSRADSVLGQTVGSPSRVLIHPLTSAEPRVVLSSALASPVLAVVATGTLVLDGWSARENLREQPWSADEDRARWLTRGSSNDRQPAYSPDGKWIAFSSLRGGSLDLWAVSTETGAIRRITEDRAEDWDPAFTQDGQLLWSSNRTGTFQIWMAAADGTGPRQITSAIGDAQNPTATPDGAWIVFSSSSGSPGVYKVRSNGTELTQLVGGNFVLAETSPDGRYVSYVANWGTRDSTLRVLRLADGTHEPFAVPLPDEPNPRGGVVEGRNRWLPDGSGIAFVSGAPDGTFGVFLQAFEPGQPVSGPPQRLAGFEPELVTESFAISPDGNHIVLALWDPVSSLLWAENVPGIEPVEIGPR